MKSEEKYKSKLVQQFKTIFIFTIVLLIGMGIYSICTGSSTGGTLYGRFGGSGKVTYGAYGFFEMAGVLILGALIFYLGSKFEK
ncbi:hypothetical protein [Mucilaginibacter kameinonensis]|uniref:hypothetical protein n=1 Tax=Mucilaginibacter kameinonensis TaxID=452286 RepID=UPI000EF82563|nr:hypothetical protein [Mucilaginibacter kameinonensis]